VQALCRPGDLRQTVPGTPEVAGSVIQFQSLADSGQAPVFSGKGLLCAEEDRRMSKLSIASVIVLVAALAISLSQPARAAGPQTPDWPLAKGAYWIYTGSVTWFNTDTQQQVEETVTWKVEVTDAVQRDHVTGYLVKGSLDDLAGYERGATPVDHVIIQVGADKFYAASEDALARLRAVDSGDDVLVDLIVPELQLLELPLSIDKVFGDPQQITRTDRMYAWWVTDAKPADVSGIAGAPAGLTAEQYTLSLKTIGDSTTLEFVPGLGIVQYTYAHYGTPAAASMRLVEYHPGQ
jgi:hypothetical protein